MFHKLFGVMPFFQWLMNGPGPQRCPGGGTVPVQPIGLGAEVQKAGTIFLGGTWMISGGFRQETLPGQRGIECGMFVRNSGAKMESAWIWL